MDIYVCFVNWIDSFSDRQTNPVIKFIIACWSIRLLFVGRDLYRIIQQKHLMFYGVGTNIDTAKNIPYDCGAYS